MWSGIWQGPDDKYNERVIAGWKRHRLTQISFSITKDLDNRLPLQERKERDLNYVQSTRLFVLEQFTVGCRPRRHSLVVGVAQLGLEQDLLQLALEAQRRHGAARARRVGRAERRKSHQDHRLPTHNMFVRYSFIQWPALQWFLSPNSIVEKSLTKKDLSPIGLKVLCLLYRPIGLKSFSK